MKRFLKETFKFFTSFGEKEVFKTPLVALKNFLQAFLSNLGDLSLIQNPVHFQTDTWVYTAGKSAQI